MRQKAAIWLLAACLLLLSACGARTEKENSFTVKVVCESQGIQQIFYTYYIGGASRGMGGMADLEGGALTEATDLTLTFQPASFDQGDDLSAFSIDFSPYGAGDTEEMATTEPLAFPVAYGERYTVIFSGSREEGFRAVLAEE